MAIKKFNSEEGFSAGYNPIDVIDANGNVIANSLFVTTSAALGSIGSITITGGSNGQAITTDGLGNLSFTTISGGSGNVAGANGAIQYNEGNLLAADNTFYYDPMVQVMYATLISADGSLLSNIPGPNVTGYVPNADHATLATSATSATTATTAGHVSANAQPNITSVGVLSSVSVLGDVKSGNANLGNAATANFFVGNGAYLSYIDGTVVIGVVANANYAEYANTTLNSNAANTVTSSAQPNITTVGTLTQLVVAGNTEANLITANSMVSNSSLLVKGDTSLLGNLIVYGNAIYADVSVLKVKDPIIEMGGLPNGDPLTANDGYDRGTLLHYYTTLPIDAFMGWKNEDGEFVFGSNVSYISNTVTVNEYGNVRANHFIGSGSTLTDITGANVTGNVPNADFSTNANFAAFAGNVTVSSQPNITSVGILSALSVSGDVKSGNANLGNLVYGNYFIGDGSNLANLNAANIVGTITNASIANATNASTANVALSVANSAQPNITSVGILSSLSVSGDVKSGNANLGNAVTANYFIGSAANLTDIPAGNIVGTIETANFAAYAGNITVSSQPNITSVGVLTSLSVSGNIKSDNANLGNAATANYFIGSAENLTNIPAGNIVGEVSNANYATYSDQANSATVATTATTAGTVTTAAQPNITSIGTLGILSVSGNIYTGNANLGNTVVGNYFVGSGNNLSNIQGANVSGEVANANFASYSDQANTANAALVAGTVSTAAQPNITSVGILSSLSVTGTSTLSNVNVSGNVSVAGNIAAANFVGNFTGNIIGNVAAPGNTTEIIFNDAGNTAASNAFTFNNTTNVVALTGNLSVTGNISRDSKNVPTYVAQSGAPSNPSIGDEWYDTDNDVTYQYVYNGVTYQWVDVTTGYINANTTAVANTLVLRDANSSFAANIIYANGGNFSGAVYSGATTSYPTQLATKAYVDQQSSTGIHIHTPVRVNTPSALIATYTPGGTALTVNTIASGNTFTTSTNHGLSLNDMIISGSTTNGLTAGTAYFVYSTPALNTFKLSATYGGDEISTFTDGTGLSINITANPGVGAKLTNAGAAAAIVIDTVTLGLTNRVLVSQQTNAFENGVYTVTDIGSISTNWELTRATDADRYIPRYPAGIGEGDYFFITEGFTGTGDSYVLTTPGVIILGTTNITYTQFSAAITYSGVSPVKVEGQSISLANTTGTGDYVVLANSPQLNTPNIGAATGNSLSLIGNLTSGNAELGNLANASFLSGTLVTASQPNISAVGTLSSLSVSGNIDSGNANLGNTATANFFTGTLTTAAQPNITSLGVLSALSVTGNANVGHLYSSNANLGNVANANYFIGDGGLLTNIAVAAGSYIFNGTSNVHLDSSGNLHVDIASNTDVLLVTDIGANVTGYANITGTLSAGNIDFTGANAYFSNIANLHIPGGSSDYILRTDGSGNLSWVAQTGGGTGNANISGSNTQIFFNDNGSNTLGTSNELTFDKSSNTLSTQSISAHGIVSFTGSNFYLSNIANVHIPGGSANYAIITDGSGNLSWGLAGTGNANVAGSNTQLQFNDSNVLGASANLTFDKTSNTLTTTVLSTTGNIYSSRILNGSTGIYMDGGYPGYINFFNSGGTKVTIDDNGNLNTGIISSSGNITGANINTGIISATGNANVGNINTANVSITGNLGFTGANFYLSNIANFHVPGGTANYAIITDGTGNLTWGLAGTGNANVAGSNTQIQFNDNGNLGASVNLTFDKTTNTLSTSTLSTTGNVNGANANLGNAVTANFFIGSGNNLSNIQASNITGTVANANYAAYAGDVINAAQSNITSVGTLTNLSVSGNSNVGGYVSAVGNVVGSNINASNNLSVTGNAIISGNLTVNGSTIYANVTTLNIKDPIIEQGGNPNGDPLTSNDGKDRGSLLHYYSGAPIDAFMGWDNANAEFALGSNVSVTSEVVTYNTFGNLRANAYIGALLTVTGNVTGANINTGGIISATGNANLGNVNTANLSVSGNVTFSGANVSLGAVGNLHITGGFPNYVLSTDGAGNLSWQAGGSGTGNAITFGNSNVDIASSGANVTVSVNGNANVAKFTGTGAIITGTASVTGNLTAANANLGNVASANFFTGTLTTASQPNITGLGTLTSLTVGPNSSLIMSGNTGYVRANSLQGRDGSQAVYLYYGNVSGSVGVVGDLTVGASGTGNLVVGNGNVTFNGTDVNLGNVSNLTIGGGSLNYVLTTDGNGNVSFSPPAGGGGVSGSNTQLQYNAAGVFAGTPGLTFDNTANRLTLQNYAVVRNQLGSGSGSRTINLNLGGYVSATSTGTTTWAFTNPTASPNASGFVLELTNGGSFVQVWPTTVRWPSSIAPTLTTTGVDLLVFITDDGGLNWRGSLVMIDSR